MVIDIRSSSTAANAATIAVASSVATNNPASAPRGIPQSVPADEMYYWTEVWQAGEAETRAALARGEGRTFDTAKDAIRYLLSNE